MTWSGATLIDIRDCQILIPKWHSQIFQCDWPDKINLTPQQQKMISFEKKNLFKSTIFLACFCKYWLNNKYKMLIKHNFERKKFLELKKKYIKNNYLLHFCNKHTETSRRYPNQQHNWGMTREIPFYFPSFHDLDSPPHYPQN